ncbi:MAG: hypothetical protein OEX01_04315 [Candidatus Bathyarchaeota archaeon]|nr:hypothetical protein [Candidatus Bathyarchaeota archaeon]
MEIAKPKIVYPGKSMHFFAYESLVMYTFGCKNNGFKQKVLDAIEFSNQTWSK